MRVAFLFGWTDMDVIWNVVDRAIHVASVACKRSGADRAKALEYLCDMAAVLQSNAPDHPALAKLKECIRRYRQEGAPRSRFHGRDLFT